MENLNISMVKNDHVTVIGSTTIEKVYELLKNPASPHREAVEEIRRLFTIGSAQFADKEKKKLPGFTCSGIFNKRREGKSLAAYSQMCLLDIDDIDPRMVNTIVERAKMITYSHLVFISPSGMGVKIVVKVDSDATEHKTAYTQISNFYKEELGDDAGKLDGKTNDIARLTYISYDPDAYFNPDSAIFHVDVSKKKVTYLPKIPDMQNIASNWDPIFFKAQAYTDKKQTFEEGNRNNYLFALSINANRYGIPLEYMHKTCIELYSANWDIKEIENCINNVYNKNEKDFGVWRNLIHQTIDDKKIEVAKKQETIESIHEDAYNTPVLPVEIINQLPPVIKNIADLLSNERERDVFVIGALTILSGCFQNVQGIYDGNVIYPNLFTFIIAPASSGKGVLKLSVDLASILHDKLIEKSKADLVNYTMAMENFKISKKQKKENIEKPEKPPFKMLLLPGNSSSAAIYQQLNDSEGMGILCETEADTINNTFKNDWGNSSDLFRKAFHHETISLKRKTDDLYIYVREPRLSVALSGTVAQVKTLIQSAENGLFSRFSFYRYNAHRAWRDVSPKNGKEKLPIVIKEGAETVVKIAEYLKTNPTEFTLSELQWEKLNNHFSTILNHVSCFVDEEASATVMRLGLISFRIAMILTAIRKFQDKLKDVQIVCSDIHFEMAIQIIDVLLQHAMQVYKELPSTSVELEGKIKLFFEALPMQFDRKTAIATVMESAIGITDRTVDKYLKRLLEYKFLTKSDYNEYRKLVDIAPKEQTPVIQMHHDDAKVA